MGGGSRGGPGVNGQCDLLALVLILSGVLHHRTKRETSEPPQHRRRSPPGIKATADAAEESTESDTPEGWSRAALLVRTKPATRTTRTASNRPRWRQARTSPAAMASRTRPHGCVKSREAIRTFRASNAPSSHQLTRAPVFIEKKTVWTSRSSRRMLGGCRPWCRLVAALREAN